MNVKKLFIFFLIFLYFSSLSFADKMLTWGINSKNIRKKLIQNQIYENDFCEIIYLPKHSYNDNDKEEYLLFSKEMGLIARLQNTDEDFSEYFKNNRSSYGGKVIGKTGEGFNISFFGNESEYNPEFPNQDSFSVITLLYGCSDYVKKDIDVSEENEASSIINYGGKAYVYRISKKYFKINDFSLEESYKYFRKENGPAIDEIVNKYKDKYVQTQLQKNQLGPFGIWWNMTPSEVNFIGYFGYDGFEELGNGFDVEQYNDLFLYDKDIIKLKSIKPQKRHDKINPYIAVFDENDHLYQLVGVNYASYTTNVKKLAEQEKNSQKNFEEMKAIICKIYGEGNVVQNRGEKCIRWKDKNGQMVELIKNNSLYTDQKGTTGQFDYVWLIYSSPNYHSIIESIKQKLNDKNLRKIQLENIQNTYF